MDLGQEFDVVMKQLLVFKNIEVSSYKWSRVDYSFVVGRGCTIQLGPLSRLTTINQSSNCAGSPHRTNGSLG
jgi:hypothetical protein